MTTTVPTVLLVLGGLAALGLAVLGMRQAPRAAFVAWAVALFFLPVWVGFSAGFFWAAITLLTVFLIATNWAVVPLRAGDAWILAFVALTTVLHGLGSVALSALVIAILEWVVPYIWGRVVLARVSTHWITGTIAGVAVAAAAFTILEFVAGWNPFILIPGSGEAHSTWSTLQFRGGVARAEGAFGHSIALGASLAMSVAFVVATRLRTVWKVFAVAIVSTGVVLTFSRAGMITLVLTLVLSTFLLPGLSQWFRMSFAVFAIFAVAVVVPLIDSVFGASDDDLAVSGGYRTDLLVLLPQIQLFGSPGDWQSRVVGDEYLGYFARSIDNALMLILLRVGWIPTILLIAVIVCAAITAVRRKTRNPAALAVVGQLPSLVVVAMITQYGMFLWFCVGLALAWSQNTEPVPSRSPQGLAAATIGSTAQMPLPRT